MSDRIPLSVVIAGGGFCGAMTAVNLIEKSNRNLSITIINNGAPLAKGIAYKTYSDLHLLNVEARNMSAFPDKPNHFVEWCIAKGSLGINIEEIPTSYLPRNVYGRYVREIFDEAVKNNSNNISLQLIDDEVIDVNKFENSLHVITGGGKIIIADKFVIATGNCEPRPPSRTGSWLLESKKYFGNPWCEGAVVGMNNHETVLIIGTGLTMVDVIIGLREKNFNGKIISLSPHGYGILPHRKMPPQRYILDELEHPYSLELLFKLFYKHIREARKRGLSGETVVDAIRVKTQEIWQRLSLADKNKFMTHLRHLWGVARHRLPAEIHLQIQHQIKENKLEVIAGRIKDAAESRNGIEVKILKRKDQSEQLVHAERIINCTGPETDIRKQRSKLFDNLIEKGIIRPDIMNLGIDAAADGRVIDSKQNISENIFAIGSLLKGKLWESTAVPELRLQAANLAAMIIETKVLTSSTIKVEKHDN